MDVDSENDTEQHEESRMLTFTVDPALSKSFLNFLYDVEDEEREAAEIQVGQWVYEHNITMECRLSGATFNPAGFSPGVIPSSWILNVNLGRRKIIGLNS